MNFNDCVEVLLRFEGGLVDHPQDPGGLTKFGISLRAYPQLGRDGIRSLTKSQAKKIYKADYWDKARCVSLPPEIRLAVFDSAVNQGVTTALKTLQKTLNVKADGIVGPITLAAAKRIPVKELVARYLAERALQYVALKTFETFGRGWMTRLFHVAQYHLEDL